MALEYQINREYCLKGKKITCVDRGINHEFWCDGCKEEFAEFHKVIEPTPQQERQVYEYLKSLLHCDEKGPGTSEDSFEQLLYYLKETTMNFPAGRRYRYKCKGRGSICLFTQGPPGQPEITWHLIHAVEEEEVKPGWREKIDRESEDR